MTSKKAALIFISALALVVGVGAFFLGRYTVKKEYITIEHRDTTYITRTIHDTLRLVEWRDRIRIDTCYLAAVQDSAKSATSADSALVQIPIEQKIYETENYKAVIKGFRTALVSMDIYQKEKIVTIEKQIAPKKWSFGVTIGATAGFFYTPAGFQPGAGVGATIGATYHF